MLTHKGRYQYNPAQNKCIFFSYAGYHLPFEEANKNHPP
jgi:hypothetical protein